MEPSGRSCHGLPQSIGGGFRRLQVATDGRGVIAADGADVASVKVVSPGSIEVAVGDDRYRLPATVKGQAGPAK